MAFRPNPLSLSVPEPAFEAWLRDTGYLEVLDERTSADPYPPPRLLRTKLTAAAGGGATAPSAAASSRSSVFVRLFSFLRTLAAVLTLNPFAKLSPDDFAGPTPPWAAGFVGPAGSYAWPAGPAQARMRAHENVRRYARNYAALAILFLACALYRMPISLLGVVVSLGVWELLRVCSRRWELEQRHPGVKQALVYVAQIVTAVVLYVCNIQIALLCATSVSYAVMLLHASLRKLTPSKQLVGVNRHKKAIFKKV